MKTAHWEANNMKILFSALLSVVFLLNTITAHSATYYFHNDHLGTPQVLTDVNQAVVWQGDYDPFGKVTETVATVEQNLRFPGQYLDRESGLHYNYFRTYDPTIGRYTQSDPIGLGGGINTYGYAYQNAISYTDPTGEFAPIVWWGATALWTAFQVAGSAYDVYGTVATFADECSSTTEKVIAGVGLAVGVALPGFGYASVIRKVPNSVPNGSAFPDRPLPRDQHGNPVPDTNAPHTQLGTRSGRNGDYPQAREFDANGKPVRDIDFTGHGRADHPNPHQHRYVPNETGGSLRRGPSEPLQYP